MTVEEKRAKLCDFYKIPALMSDILKADLNRTKNLDRHKKLCKIWNLALYQDKVIYRDSNNYILVINLLYEEIKNDI